MSNITRVVSFKRLALLMLGLMFSWTVVVRAQADTAQAKSGNGMDFSEDKLSQIEENLVRDLESPSTGICIGGAQTARELKQHVPGYDFSKIIIPLMRIVKDENADRAARILAALALNDLDSERGNFAISREGEMAKDEIFKSFCANLARVRMAKEKEQK
jgi:hypothetical protein